MDTEILFFGYTHPGLRRSNNEDRIYWKPLISDQELVRYQTAGQSPYLSDIRIDDTFYYQTPSNLKILLIVIDGMGGQAAGEEAARIAEEALVSHIRRAPDKIEPAIRKAIIEANNAIYAEADSHAGWQGMACVLTVAVVENNRVTMGHVGDTRLYKFRPHADPIKLSRDQSPIGEREDKGEISEEEAMRNPRRNEVYNDVGSQPRDEADANNKDYILYDSFEFAPHEALLLCSDGLTDLVTIREIQDIIEKYAADPVAVTAHLVNAANERGGKDNISVIFVAGNHYAYALTPSPDEAQTKAVASQASYAADAPTRMIPTQPLAPYDDKPLNFNQPTRSQPPNIQQRQNFPGNGAPYQSQQAPEGVPTHSAPAPPLPPGRNSGQLQRPPTFASEEAHRQYRAQTQATRPFSEEAASYVLPSAAEPSNKSFVDYFKRPGPIPFLRVLVGVLVVAIMLAALVYFYSNREAADPTTTQNPSLDTQKSNKLVVGRNEKLHTIDDAIKEAKEGDTIEIQPGTYAESLVITRSLTLQSSSAGEDVVLEPPADLRQGTGISINNANVTLTSIKVTGTTEIPLATGIQIVGTGTVKETRLRRVTISGTTTTALDVRGSTTLTLDDCHLENDNRGSLLTKVEPAKVNVKSQVIFDREQVALQKCMAPAQVKQEGKSLKCINVR